MLPEEISIVKKYLTLIMIIAAFLLPACQSLTPTAASISIIIVHDSQSEKATVPQGSTIKQALALVNLTLGSLDRTEPDVDEIVTPGETIKVIRVKEDYVVQEKTLPFDSQTVKNESLPAGQTLLIQAGINGVESDTYRVVSEDGVETSRTVVKTEITTPAQSQIVMLGIQSPFKSVPIEGVLAYISSSNAWIMESNTGNRREVVTTGDLDGRIFTLSPDGKWLLYSRSADSQDKDIINSLWVVNLEDTKATPVSLGIDNVVHYAEWIPGKEMTIAYSTVEPRSTAPGWQANNDLRTLNFDATGKQITAKTVIDTNSGGIYGWWGTIYAWAPDSSEIAYARPDSVGLVDAKAGQLNPIVEFTPYQTQGDWAWVPGMSWNPAGHEVLFAVLPTEDPSNSANSFELDATLVGSGGQISLQANTGMFSYPSTAPADAQGRYQVAYLTATLPEQSDTSRYELRVMDRDGSNMKKLYPDEGVQGLDPQQVVWSPDTANLQIAFVAQGNLMFVDPNSGNVQQITGDGSVSNIDWKK